jgi:hypothetical protein
MWLFTHAVYQFPSTQPVRLLSYPPPPFIFVSVEYKGLIFFYFHKCMKTDHLLEDVAACVWKDEAYELIAWLGVLQR